MKVQLVKKTQNCDRTARRLLEGLTLHFLYFNFEAKNIRNGKTCVNKHWNKVTHVQNQHKI